MDINIEIGLPEVWGSQKFSKLKWGPINLIVGPNGTGKSIFAEKLKEHLQNSGLKVRFLNAERLSGMERQNYGNFGNSNISGGFNISYFGEYKNQAERFGLSSDAFVILKERLDVRTKIESLLSGIFGRSIRLVEEGGFLKPKIQKLHGGLEYNLKESECHGLKELITLLTFLYDDGKNCLILDEPELHLHPQFQAFFLSEIRKMAGDPIKDFSKKCFFIITHSPYFLDLRTVEDLKNVLIFQKDSIPTYIENVSQEDELSLKRFLPRLNTHHKQFFFSPNPVFVEGYTDQQIISLLFDKLNKNIGAAGSSLIDVGGKEELDVFFRLCSTLRLDARFIVDLDVLFKGKLRQTISQDQRSKKYIQDTGIGVELTKEIGDIETILSEIATDLSLSHPLSAELIPLVDFYKTLDKEDLYLPRLSTLMVLLRNKDLVLKNVRPDLVGKINLVIGRVSKVVEAFRQCNVFILEKGEIEHYYTSIPNPGFVISKKDKLFETERDFLLGCEDQAELQQKYSSLLITLSNCIPIVSVNLIEHLKFVIIEWIQKVQWSVAKERITTLESLRAYSRLEYALFNQLFDVLEFNIMVDQGFICKIKVKQSIIPSTPEIVFDQNTTPFQFRL